HANRWRGSRTPWRTRLSCFPPPMLFQALADTVDEFLFRLLVGLLGCGFEEWLRALVLGAFFDERRVPSAFFAGQDGVVVFALGFAVGDFLDADVIAHSAG